MKERQPIGAKRLWESVLGELQLQVPREVFDAYFRDTSGGSFDNGAFVVLTPNTFVFEMLDSRYRSMIAQRVEALSGRECTLRFEVAATPQRRRRRAAALPREADDSDAQLAFAETGQPVYDDAARPPHRREDLNDQYRFENFVVGSSNNLAHAAAVAVTENLGTLYNPLVLYSGVGLGKTHLMQAIGHRVRENGKDALYSTTEEFTNEYIKSIREGTTERFRDHYRSADILLLDDIQFLIDKEQTQQGFFHTFNVLHNAKKQIIITSDRPVSKLSVLHDRVFSRLVAGLVVDIQAPDFETRVEILRSKARRNRWSIPERALEYIARNVKRNVRELEGCLNIVAAHARLGDRSLNGAKRGEIGLRDVERILEDALRESPRKVSEDDVVDAVSTYYTVDKSTLKGKKRDRTTAQARHVAMYLLREEVQLPLATIGRVMGGRDHSTVIHACRRIERQLEENTRLRRDVMNIREAIAA